MCSCMVSVSVFFHAYIVFCILCSYCGSSQCCILHDLQFVNTGRGCKGDHMEEAFS